MILSLNFKLIFPNIIDIDFYLIDEVLQIGLNEFFDTRRI